MKKIIWGSLIVLALLFSIMPKKIMHAVEYTAAKVAPKFLAAVFHSLGILTTEEKLQLAIAEVSDDPSLPRVLLLGDSISVWYTLPVRASLKGIANVHRPPVLCKNTKGGIEKLDSWLGSGHWDIIHFNFGLHDLTSLEVPNQDKQAVALDDYGNNLRKIVLRLKKTNAKLIFATTTPVPAGALRRKEGLHRNYNEVALKIMKEMNIEVDDLCGYVEQLQSQLPPLPPWHSNMTNKELQLREGDIQLPYNVHFTDDGYQRLAGLVVAALLKELPQQER